MSAGGVDIDEGRGSLSAYPRNTCSDMAPPIDVQEDQLFCECELCGEQMEYRDAMDHAMKHQQVANKRPRPLPPPPNHSPGGPPNNLAMTITENIRPSSVDSDDSGIAMNGSGTESATIVASAAKSAADVEVPVQNGTEKGKGAKRSRKSTATATDKSENGKRKRARKEPAKSDKNANQMPVQENHAGNHLMPPVSWQSFPPRPPEPNPHPSQQRSYPAVRQCLETTTTRMVVREGTTWYPPEHRQRPPPPPSYHYHHQPSMARQHHGFQLHPRHYQMPPQGSARNGQHNQFYYPHTFPTGAHPVPAHYTRPRGPPHDAAYVAYHANVSRLAQSNHVQNTVPNTSVVQQRQCPLQMPRLYPSPSVPMHLTQSSVRNVHQTQQSRPSRPPERVFHTSGGQCQNQQLRRPVMSPEKQSEIAKSDENSRQSTSDDCQSPVLPVAEAVYDPSLIYTCEFCSQRFTTELEIRTHTRDDHSILKDYVWCNVCGFKFDGSTDHLKNHLESAHGAINVNADVNWW